jgi:hypothetical protein
MLPAVRTQPCGFHISLEVKRSGGAGSTLILRDCGHGMCPLQYKQAFCSNQPHTAQSLLSRWLSLTVLSPRRLRNPKVHDRVHKSRPSAPFLTQINPIRTKQTHFLDSHFNNITSHLRPGLPSGLVTSGRPIILYTFPISSTRVTYHSSNQP